MIYILLSIIILIAQAFLGMAEWWVLGCNWIVAGLICLGLTAVLNNQSLVAFNNISVSLKAWVLLASIMNLSAIYVVPTLSLSDLNMSAIGFSGLLMIGFFCWQSKQMPIRALSLGAILGLLTLFYMPSLIWILVPLLIIFHLSSWSKENIFCIVTGLLTLIWINYCLLNFFWDSESANGYILSFVTSWNDMSYGLPDLQDKGYTGLVFLVSTLILLAFYTILGIFSSNFNSLRMRSNVSLQCTICLFLFLLLPTCWSLFLVLSGIAVCIHIILALGNDPTRMMINRAHFFIYFFLFMGIGEYLIVQAIDYISTISFSLPFSIPFWD